MMVNGSVVTATKIATCNYHNNNIEYYIKYSSHALVPVFLWELAIVL